MNSLDLGMIHSCNVLRAVQDQKLNFSSGSVVFTVGSVITGETSEAAGTVKSITVSTGSWASGNATGYLILSNVSGTFENETIHDEGITPGSATASGPAIPHTNGVGTPISTTTSTPYSCKFTFVSVTGGIQNLESGEYIVSSPLAFLPDNAIVTEGDIITTSEPYWAGSYKVQKIEVFEDFFTGNIDHIEAFLKKVAKRG